MTDNEKYNERNYYINLTNLKNKMIKNGSSICNTIYINNRVNLIINKVNEQKWNISNLLKNKVKYIHGQGKKAKEKNYTPSDLKWDLSHHYIEIK